MRPLNGSLSLRLLLRKRLFYPARQARSSRETADEIILAPLACLQRATEGISKPHNKANGANLLVGHATNAAKRSSRRSVRVSIFVAPSAQSIPYSHIVLSVSRQSLGWLLTWRSPEMKAATSTHSLARSRGLVPKGHSAPGRAS